MTASSSSPQMAVTAIEYRDRCCDLCGGSDFELVSAYEHQSLTRTGVVAWSVRNVVCRTCGFALVSPVPTQKALAAYYGDSYARFAAARPDYSLANRLEVLEIYRGDGGQFIEIGSNRCAEFLEAAAKLFRVLSTVELNEDCDSTARSTTALDSGIADVVASYFVLEHVPEPQAFLAEMARLCRAGGHVVVEVPDLALYPRDPSGLMLHEHVNHFSATSLAHLARRAGLDVVEVRHEGCSRPFGFTMVLRKAGRLAELPADPTARHDALACMREGWQRYTAFIDQITQVWTRVSPSDRVVIWGANELCARLIENRSLPDKVLLLDSDPAKRDYFPGREVRLPSDHVEDIRAADHLILCTPVYAREILDWIERHTGRSVDAGRLSVLRPSWIA